MHPTTLYILTLFTFASALTNPFYNVPACAVSSPLPLLPSQPPTDPTPAILRLHPPRKLRRRPQMHLPIPRVDVGRHMLRRQRLRLRRPSHHLPVCKPALRLRRRQRQPAPQLRREFQTPLRHACDGRQDGYGDRDTGRPDEREWVYERGVLQRGVGRWCPRVERDLSDRSGRHDGGEVCGVLSGGGEELGGVGVLAGVSRSGPVGMSEGEG